VITVIGNYQYAGDRLGSVQFTGGYTGFRPEGLPVVEWQGRLVMTYDDKGRLESEQFAVDSFTKTYTEKPESETRKLIKDLYPSFRPERPIDVMRTGDLCGMKGNQRLINLIDLRPFYTISPSFPTLLPFGTQKMTIDYTYPDDYVAVSK
jgi:hypothetical protein